MKVHYVESHVNVLEEIQNRLSDVSEAESRVARAVLADPHAAIDASIGVLAGQAHVSEPTVLRFCRSIGFQGFRDFKLRLAQSLAVGVPYVHRQVEPGDEVSAYIRKVGRSAVDLLTNIVNKLDPDCIECAVATLASARRIEFWGFGASAVVALDAHQKFFRLGTPCSAYSDSHMQCMSASTLGPDDVVVAISHTGRSKELVENARTARNWGATVIGLTASQSPLARECSQVIGVDVEEDTDVFPPMVSRLAHLIVLDILVVGVALRRGHQMTERLQRMKEALALKRFPEVGGEPNEHCKTS
jgi:RpiR family carbohydrate utilization transcriptional regulator